MIVISGVLVVLALVLLIAGVLADSLPLIYMSIAVSAVSFLSLVFGVRQRKDEQLPGSASAGAGMTSGHVEAPSRSSGSVALLERVEAPAPERSAPAGGGPAADTPQAAESPSLADTAVLGGSRGSTLVSDSPAAGTSRPHDAGYPETPETPEADQPEGEQPEQLQDVDEASADLLEEDYEEYDYEGYEEEGTEGIVLVINGRPRYHVEGCRFVAGKDAEAIAVEDAREEGFTACGVCRPDEALAAAAELYDEEEYDDEEYEESGADAPLEDAEAPAAGPRELGVVPGLTPVAAEPAPAGEADDELAEYVDEYDEYDDEEYDEDDEEAGYADSGEEDEDAEVLAAAHGTQPDPDEDPAAGLPPVSRADTGPVHAGPAAARRADDLGAHEADEVDELDDLGLLEEPEELEDEPVASAQPVTPLDPAPAVAASPAPTRSRRVTGAAEGGLRSGAEGPATGARPVRRGAAPRPAARPVPSRRPARPAAAAAPAPVPADVPAPPPRTSTRGRVAVIPDRGRYHRPECRYVRESPDAIEITKQRATKQGYVPCGVCKP